MPSLYVVAGVNGSGKSTLTKHNRFNNVRVIDPDAIAKHMSMQNDESADTQAGREAIRLRQSYLATNQSFVLETTLSGHGTARLMERARAQGYHVELHYIYLIDEDQSADRVATRVSKGGHHIPRADIERRFERSRANFKRAALIADETVVYDNAGIDDAFQGVMVATLENFEIDPHAPDWLVQSVARICAKATALGGRMAIIWN